MIGTIEVIVHCTNYFRRYYKFSQSPSIASKVLVYYFCGYFLFLKLVSYQLWLCLIGCATWMMEYWQCPKFRYLRILCSHQGSGSSSPVVLVIVIQIDKVIVELVLLVTVVVALVRGLVFTHVPFVCMVVPGNGINLKNQWSYYEHQDLCVYLYITSQRDIFFLRSTFFYRNTLYPGLAHSYIWMKDPSFIQQWERLLFILVNNLFPTITAVY